MSIHISFSYIFFLCPLLIQRGRKQRNARPLSLSRSFILIYIYAQQKSSRVFFWARTISLTAKVYNNEAHGGKKKQLVLIERSREKKKKGGRKKIFEESTTNKNEISYTTHSDCYSMIQCTSLSRSPHSSSTSFSQRKNKQTLLHFVDERTISVFEYIRMRMR